jgi:hypothetical protein
MAADKIQYTQYLFNGCTLVRLGLAGAYKALLRMDLFELTKQVEECGFLVCIIWHTKLYDKMSP